MSFFELTHKDLLANLQTSDEGLSSGEAARRLSNLGQGGQPQDVGEAITFLSTPGAAGITGRVLRVCGGALVGA